LPGSCPWVVDISSAQQPSFGEVGTLSPFKRLCMVSVLEKRYDLLAEGGTCDREHRC
jgi:hypothetical protein